MTKFKFGVVASLAASVSVITACQLSTPNQTVGTKTENTIGSGVSKGGANNAGSTGSITNPGTLTQTGDATVRGKVLDEQGRPVAGAVVMNGSSQALTGPDGSYTLKVTSGDAVNIKVVKDGFILRDTVLPITKGQTLEVTSSLVKADEKVTRIAATEGGKVVSSDGQTELIIPAGALKADADVRITWLDPSQNATRPAAFKIAAVSETTQPDAGAEEAGLGDTGVTGGKVDETPEPSVPKITELNTSDLPGPLETTAYGDRKYFSAVAFANVTMNAELKDGETATLRMAVSREVQEEMLRQGDLKESDLNQDIFPCFSWSTDDSTWDKPALSKVVKDEKGKYWFEYTVRANSMSPAVAKFQTLAIGDGQGSARVELVVGGGRRVVDGTFTYGALIERSSNPEYDFHGFKNAVLEGGALWTTAGGNYRAPNRSDLIRPNVTTDNYTGTNYAATMGAENFSKWDREGMFRLSFPPGERFEINAPKVMTTASSADGNRTGYTETATKSYLTPDPSGNVVQTQGIASTYVAPFYYNTDAKLTLKFQSVTEPDGKTYTIKYTVNGQAKEASANVSQNSVTVSLARNAAGTAQTILVKEVGGDGYMYESTTGLSVTLPVGGAVTQNITLTPRGAK